MLTARYRRLDWLIPRQYTLSTLFTSAAVLLMTQQLLLFPDRSTFGVTSLWLEYYRYDTKQSDSEASVMVELWGMRSISSLLQFFSLLPALDITISRTLVEWGSLNPLQRCSRWSLQPRLSGPEETKRYTVSKHSSACWQNVYICMTIWVWGPRKVWQIYQFHYGNERSFAIWMFSYFSLPSRLGL